MIGSWIPIFAGETQGAQEDTDTLASVLASVTSAAARQDYRASAATLIASGAQASAVLGMIEAVAAWSR